MSDNFTKIILTGIFVCLVAIALKSVDVNVSAPNPNINVNSDSVLDGKEIVQLAPNRIAIIDNVRYSGTEGTILIFDFDNETKIFTYTGTMNYTDYYKNPSNYGIPITTNPPKVMK